MAQNFNFPNHISGDTYPGVTFSVNRNSYAINLTGAQIKADFRRDSADGEIALSFSVGSGITITNTATGTFQIDQFNVDLDAGAYLYDIQFTLQDGTIKTYISGTWTILPSITD